MEQPRPAAPDRAFCAGPKNRTSAYGRDYRMGYGLTVAESSAMSFELDIDAARHESRAGGHGTRRSGPTPRAPGRRRLGGLAGGGIAGFPSRSSGSRRRWS